MALRESGNLALGSETSDDLRRDGQEEQWEDGADQSGLDRDSGRVTACILRMTAPDGLRSQRAGGNRESDARRRREEQDGASIAQRISDFGVPGHGDKPDIDGIDREMGGLIPGKEAHLIFLKADALNVAPLNHAPGAVVTLMKRSNVEAAFVAGQVRKWAGKLLGSDTDCLRRELGRSCSRILAATGLERDLFRV